MNRKRRSNKTKRSVKRLLRHRGQKRVMYKDGERQN
jgi:hypothetical protein